MAGGKGEGGAPRRVGQRGKLIDLRDHQAAEQALDHLLSSDPASSAFAGLLASALSAGAPLLAAIVRRVDASQSRTLEALGHIISHYPDRSEAISTLMRVAYDRRNSDNRRVGAVMLLEHFLHVLPPSDFAATLRDPARVAVNSLLNVLGDNAADPNILNDYLRDLISQPPDLLYSILGMLSEAGGPHAIDVLQLLALQTDAELRIGAIDALVADASPHAIRSLAALERNLPPDSARLVSRSLQKLRLSGVDIEPPVRPSQHCRALLSQIDGRGDRLLWLVVPPSSGQRGQVAFLGLLVNDMEGLQDALGCPIYPADAFPPYSATGKLHMRVAAGLGDLAADGPFSDPSFVCIDVPFCYALNLVARAVRRNWASGTSLPVDYQLLNGMVWEHYAETESEAVADVGTGPASRDLVDVESELLSIPLFANWYLDSQGVHQTAEEVANLGGSLPHQLTDENWHLLLPALIRLAHDEFGTEMRLQYSRRLTLMAEWLTFARQDREAALAYSAAHTIVHSPPEANLFVLRLVQRGILVALSELLPGR